MKLIPLALALSSSAFLWCAPSNAWADSPFSVALGVGQANGNADSSTLKNDLLGLGFYSAEASSKNKDTAFQISARYQWLKHLAIEAAYLDLGKRNARASVTPPGTLDLDIKSNVLSVSVVGLLPIGEQFTLYAKGGVGKASTKASLESSGFVELERSGKTVRTTTGILGLGAEYNVTRQVAITLDITRFTRLGSSELGGKFDSDAAMLGARFAF